ncbi:MAG TPA: hypothetical protein VF533_03430 [Solirubrobacteraceae bacterium]|jgi:hypothetical protein
MLMRTTSRPAATTEEAFDRLPGDLRVTLALLHQADDGLAELTIATLALGSRALLAALGAITSARQPDADAPVVVSLTSFGRDLITACAVAGLPDDVTDDLSALEEARARRSGASTVDEEDLTGASA